MPCQVLYIAGLPVIDEALHSQREAHEQAYLEHAVTTLGASPAVEIRTSLLKAPIVPALLQFVASADVDLIVMTTHGASGFERAWLGSVTDQLVRQSPVPVLVVRGSAGRPRSAVPTFERVLIPLDSSDRSRAVLPYALGIGGRAARYTLATVSAPFDAAAPNSRVDVEQRRCSAEALAEIAARLTDEGYLVETRIIVAEHPAAALLAEAQAGQHSLIALATRGQSGLQRNLLGSVSDKLLRAAKVPVLVYCPATSASSDR